MCYFLRSYGNCHWDKEFANLSFIYLYIFFRQKPQLTSPSNESSHSPTSSQPLSPAEPQGTKRTNEETLDPTAKRPRWSHHVVSKPTRRNNNNTSSEKGETVSSSQPDSRLSSKPKTANNSSLDSRNRDEPVLTNGTSSPARKPFSASPLAHGSPRHRLNGIHSNHHASGSHSPINGMTNGLTNGHGNPHHKTNGHLKSEPTTPSSSPDNHNTGEDAKPSYLKYVCVCVFYFPFGSFISIMHLCFMSY